MSNMETQLRDASVSSRKIVDEKNLYMYTITTAGDDITAGTIVSTNYWDETNSRLVSFPCDYQSYIALPRGVAMATVSMGDALEIRSRAYITGVDTSLYPVGTPLYLGPNGTILYAQPEGPDMMVYLLGYVLVSDATAGILGVDPTYGHMINLSAQRYGNLNTFNLAMGDGSLDHWVSGDYNTAVGASTGNYQETGDYNTYVGVNADTDSKASTYRTVVGAQAEGTEDNSVTLGRAGTDKVHIALPQYGGKSATFPKEWGRLKFEEDVGTLYASWRDHNGDTHTQEVGGSLPSNIAYTDVNNNFSANQTVTGVVNATLGYQLDGEDINTGGVLSNVAYLNTANVFSNTQTISENFLVTIGSDPSVRAYMNGDDTSSPAMRLYKSRGTYESPTIVLQNDPLGRLEFSGYTAAGWSTSGDAKILAHADEVWGVGASGTRMTFQVKAHGTNSLVDAIVVRHDETDIAGTANASTLNAWSDITLNDVSINTGGALSNVAYKNQVNAFTASQTVVGSVSTTTSTTAFAGLYSADSTSGASFITYKSRGTASVPTATQSGDRLGQVQFRGYGATGWSSGTRAGIDAVAAENFTDTAQGAYARILATKPGTASAVSPYIFYGDKLSIALSRAGSTSPTNYVELVTTLTADSGTITGSSSALYASIGTTGADNITAAIGATITGYHYGTGTATTLRGLLVGMGTQTNGGNITTGTVLDVQAYSTGTGVISNLYGVRIRNPSGYGTPTNVYALYFDNNATAEVTYAKYGIYMGTVSGATGDANYAIYTNEGLLSFGDRIFARGLGTLSGKADVQYDTSTKEIGYVSSSIRHKVNIAYEPDTSWIYNLSPVRYDRKDGSRNGEIGLIAEEVELIKPDICAYDEMGNLITYSRSELIIPLLKELIDLEERITALENPGSIDKRQSLIEKLKKGIVTRPTVTAKEWIKNDKPDTRPADLPVVPPIPGPRDPEPAGD